MSRWLIECATFVGVMKFQALKYFLILVFCHVLPVMFLGQTEESTEMVTGPSSVREEVERYFGYEDLTYRYLTLPYDVGANVNQQGSFVDIGYLIFAVGPICLLMFFYKNKRLFYLVMLLLVVYLSLCFRFSHLRDVGNQIYHPFDSDINSLTTPTWEGSLLSPIYRGIKIFSEPIVLAIGSLTGTKDHFTYPLIIGVFLVILFFLLRSSQISQRIKMLSLISFAFFFLWWMLSGGIIWYGYLLLPMVMLFIFHTILSKKTTPKLPLFKVVQIAVVFWVFLAFILRISNINIVNYQVDRSNVDHGKLIVEPRIHPYSVGEVSKDELVASLAPNLSTALRTLNSGEGFIYQIGSSLNFEIRNNDERILEDNTLSYFYRVANNFRSREAISNRLKKLGFKYIIFDPLTPTLDKTPEKTLTQKYRIFLNFLLNNQQLRLVATDQQVELKKPDGTTAIEYGFFGDRVNRVGTYAVFEVI